MFFNRYPEISHEGHLISASQAAQLGDALLAQHQDTLIGADEELRFNQSLSGVGVYGNLTTQIVTDVCNKVCPDAANLLTTTVCRSIATMSGLRPGGLPQGCEPDYLRIGVNFYEPNETFGTHIDNGVRHDVSIVSLIGEAEFMAVKPREVERGAMPTRDQITKSWESHPGTTLTIRNHQTADYQNLGYPRHAVQNGADERLALLVELFYKL